MKFFVKLILDLFDTITEKKITRILRNIFEKKIPIIIDVGSHKGEYIFNIIKNFEFEKIYSFEPNPMIFDILKKNLNEYENIQINNLGVGEYDKKEILNDNIESSSTSINKLNKSSKYFKKKYFFLNPLNNKSITNPIEINLITLNSFIKQEEIENIDLLKIDTEGYELKVLLGLGDKIKKINYIHFEHHFDDMIIKKYTLSNIHNHLISHNFKKIFKIKMKFRKSFEYIYENQKKYE